ncbi:MAG TPA: hypothetical protein DEA08_22705 [Planctomycetes bacterium]|nr:hypothetical protein [Planctomycetota bacterium]
MGRPKTTFRWNLSNPRLYRRLGKGRVPQVPSGFKRDLLTLAHRTLRAAGDADLVFVGRSLESVYHLLSGALEGTSWRERLQLLAFSCTRDGPGELRRKEPGALAQLWLDFEQQELTPAAILARERPLAFVDVVFGGRTYGNLHRLLQHWSESRADWARLRRQLRWVCLVERDHPRWETWEPNEFNTWTEAYEAEQFRLVPLPSDQWRFLAEDQPKTTPSHPPWRWSDPSRLHPPTDAEHLSAARLARAIFRYGGWSRRDLIRGLKRPRPLPWLEPLLAELRRRG